MKINFDCLECGLHSFIKLMKEFEMPEPLQDKAMKEFLSFLSTIDYSESPPVMSKYYHKMIRKLLDSNDPYYDKKRFYNQKILSQYQNFMSVINETNNSARAAFMLAISGNIIDFGPNQFLNIEETINNALKETLSIDHFSNLISDIHRASGILYILDNAGEIVFDKMFIERLISMEIADRDKIVAVVRGEPVINDAIMEDAEESGLTDIVKVIDTGDCAPGIILKDTSEEFKEYFYKADLIIAKGQGNYETLNNINRNNIYFLFIAKCPVIADELNVPRKSFICMKKGESR